MRYVKLGKTGLEVSVITLGCMSFGEPEGRGRPWTLDEAECRDIVRQALDAGINFFDTANIYAVGRSEEITGAALKDFVPRDEVVLATKVFMPMRRGPNGGGLSRKAILAEVDASLRRLQTDYIDLYQIHRWDSRRPSRRPWRRCTTS
jgi:aryl-alcohol dehydrogenase-like predicted oxidoreductase